MYIYLLTNKNNSVIYVGVTNDIKRRLYEHKLGINEGFTKKYNITKLVYYEEYSDPNLALRREKQLKSWRRDKKISLINGANPEWKDISL